MQNPRQKLQPGKMLCELPGVMEALQRAQARQMRTRENSLLDLTYDLCGLKVRTMTVLDYVLLDRNNSPFVRRLEPSLDDLAFFLWALSPQFLKWTERRGWRRWFPFLERLEAFFHGRKVRRMFGRNMPETSEPVVIAAFEYIDVMFFDRPPSMAGAGESPLAFLTSWFDSMQSEYHFPSEQVWKMGLPELFQRLAAIRQRRMPHVPDFNRDTDAVNFFILRGLRSKAFTLDDLAAGKVEFPKNFSRN